MTTSHEKRELVLVTGASSGIGKATADRLAADGFHVLAGVRSQADADQIARSGIEPVILDVTNGDHVVAVATRVENDPEKRALRAVINNAGVAVNAPIEVLSAADWRAQFDASFFGPIALTRALMSALLAGRGRILNITSVGGRVAMANFGAYSAAKFALEAATDSLRREVFKHNIRTTIISPGLAATELRDHIGDPAVKAALNMRAGAMRQLEAQDIAEAILYAVTRPDHVGINEILMRSVDQEA